MEFWPKSASPEPNSTLDPACVFFPSLWNGIEEDSKWFPDPWSKDYCGEKSQQHYISKGMREISAIWKIW